MPFVFTYQKLSTGMAPDLLITCSQVTPDGSKSRNRRASRTPSNRHRPRPHQTPQGTQPSRPRCHRIRPHNRTCTYLASQFVSIPGVSGLLAPSSARRASAHIRARGYPWTPIILYNCSVLLRDLCMCITILTHRVYKYIYIYIIIIIIIITSILYVRTYTHTRAGLVFARAMGAQSQSLP